MTTIMIALWGVAAALLWLSILTLPRWFVRSMHRHRLWRHRDRIVGAVLAGRLPRHPAVWELLNDVERSIASAHRLTLFRVISAQRSFRRLTPAAKMRWVERCRVSSADDIDPAARTLFREYQARTEVLATGNMLLGSWLGVLMVLAMVVFDIWDDRRAIFNRSVLARAADEVVTRTKIGQAASRSVTASLQMEEPALT